MITTHIENFESTLPEMEDILKEHWEELATHKDKVPLSPQYLIYFNAEKEGKLIFIVLRDSGRIVGYLIGFLGYGLHYSTCLECRVDIFYVNKKVRGSWLPGLNLFSTLEEELKRRKVQRWYAGSKVYADVSAIFKRKKAELIETYYCKWIGE